MGLHLNFVTPLWTADATGDARHVEGTALIGSLRWWYEALIRGMGGWACSPTDADHRCEVDAEAFQKSWKAGCEHKSDSGLCAACTREVLTALGVCPACQLFGATGWGKLFRLRVTERTRRAYPPTAVEDTTRPVTSARSIRVRPSGGGRGYFYPAGLAESVLLSLHPRCPGDEHTLVILYGLLEFIRRSAALGAKTNLGYGLFRWARRPGSLDLIASAFAQMVSEQAKPQPSAQAVTWPSLDEMFFADVDVAHWQPRRFADFKHNLRAAFHDGANVSRLVPDRTTRDALRHFVLGSIQESPSQAAKIKMGLLPDRRTLRLWGWVPRDLPGGVDRDDVVDLVHSGFAATHIRRWREFDSPRDTIDRFTDRTEYLSSHMEEER
jgi:CRISPR-associated protein Cmr1